MSSGNPVNCIICGNEFDLDELNNSKLFKINSTTFKVCEKCFNMSDPEEDYLQVKKIVNSYLDSIEIKKQAEKDISNKS